MIYVKPLLHWAGSLCGNSGTRRRRDGRVQPLREERDRFGLVWRIARGEERLLPGERVYVSAGATRPRNGRANDVVGEGTYEYGISATPRGYTKFSKLA